jgi:hypothetical protein
VHIVRFYLLNFRKRLFVRVRSTVSARQRRPPPRHALLIVTCAALWLHKSGRAPRDFPLPRPEEAGEKKAQGNLAPGAHKAGRRKYEK